MRVVVLGDRGYPKNKMANLSTRLLSKPILISEFLKMVVDDRQTEKDSVINNRRESDTPKKHNSDFKGAHVLVVDDNDINIEVAAGILSCLSLDIDTASNGEEAITKLAASVIQNNEYHCVFMDCQMPILNGYDAAKMIRAGKAKEQNINIPIVAMTANAMMGEKQKCLDAGMSDYITKPISAEKLVATATKWLSSTFKSPSVTLAEQVKDKKSTQTTNINKSESNEWDKDAALSRLLNNENLLTKVCTLFLQSAPLKLSELESAIDTCDLNQIGRLSHGLKGSSGDIGAASLHKQFSELEVEADKGEIALESIKHKFNLIKESYTNLEHTLKQYLATQANLVD